MGAYLGPLKLVLRNQNSGWKFLKALLQLKTLELNKESFCVTVEYILAEEDRLLVASDIRVSGQRHANDVLLRRKLNTLVIKVCHDQRPQRWDVSGEDQQQRKYTFVLYHHFATLL